jgi:hypothetical protein
MARPRYHAPADLLVGAHVNQRDVAVALQFLQLRGIDVGEIAHSVRQGNPVRQSYRAAGRVRKC